MSKNASEITVESVNGEEHYTLLEGSFALVPLIYTRRTEFVEFNFVNRESGTVVSNLRCKWSPEKERYSEVES